MSRRSNPPYSPGPDAYSQNINAVNSPWNDNDSEQSGYESFNLPPIDDLFSNSQYFNPSPRFISPEPFLPPSRNDPPPSNQQARRRPAPISQYRVASESPDPFDDFLNLPPSPGNTMPPSRRTTRSSSVVDLTETSPPSNELPLPLSSRKRKAETPGVGRASKTTRPRSSSPNSTRQECHADVAVVDLVDVENDKQYEALRAKEQAELVKAQNEAEANKPIKLAAFECIICMSNPTDLTVTHCGTSDDGYCGELGLLTGLGHLFCAECLHHALYAGDKKCCPVCRTIINPGKAGAKQPKNGVFALEMKLMTAKKMGKQPVKAQ